MQLKLDSIILFVSDLEKLTDFYHHVLGLTILENIPSEWVLLAAGSANIGLHKVGSAYADAVSNKTPDDSNIKIVFESEENIHQLRQRLTAKGVLLKEITSFDGFPYWLCDGQDTEGNVFQIRQKKSLN